MTDFENLKHFPICLSLVSVYPVNMWVYNLYVHTEYFTVFISAFQDNFYYFAFRSYGTAPVNLNIKTGGRVYGTTGKFIFAVASIGKSGIYLNKS